jgi:hypothetical protein
MLRDEFAAILIDYVVPVNSVWFQEDGVSLTPAVSDLAFFMLLSSRGSVESIV